MKFWNEENLKEALQTTKSYNFPENWEADGMVIWQGNFLPGNMVLAKNDGDPKGILLENFPDVVSQC